MRSKATAVKDLQQFSEKSMAYRILPVERNQALPLCLHLNKVQKEAIPNDAARIKDSDYASHGYLEASTNQTT